MTVCIIMGSASDREIADKAAKVLGEMGVQCELHVCSAHRTPDRLRELVVSSKADVFIAIAGLSAALPGAVAAHTIKPVIGVPVSGKVNLDSILSVVQMPSGVPVGAVGLDRSDNAALLAVEVLALKDPALVVALKRYREKIAASIAKDDESVRGASSRGAGAIGPLGQLPEGNVE